MILYFPKYPEVDFYSVLYFAEFDQSISSDVLKKRRIEIGRCTNIIGQNELETYKNMFCSIRNANEARVKKRISF